VDEEACARRSGRAFFNWRRASKAHVEGGAVSSSQAVGIGLIVRELVINALKHPFPGDRSDGPVAVTYERAEPNWRLTVSDNGIG
jgi:two-component sensor histidine kinase